jgi:hypothetical protein
MGTGASTSRSSSRTTSQESDFNSRATFINVIDASSSGSMRGLSMDESKLKGVPKSPEIKNLINAALKGKFMFASLNSAQLVKLIDVFSPVVCKAGEKIIEQGGVGDYM